MTRRRKSACLESPLLSPSFGAKKNWDQKQMMSFREPQPSTASSTSLLPSASGVCLIRVVSGTRSSSGQSRSPGMWICIRTPSAASSFTVGSLHGWSGEVVGSYSRSVLLLARWRLFVDSLLTRSRWVRVILASSRRSLLSWIEWETASTSSFETKRSSQPPRRLNTSLLALTPTCCHLSPMLAYTTRS